MLSVTTSRASWRTHTGNNCSSVSATGIIFSRTEPERRQAPGSYKWTSLAEDVTQVSPYWKWPTRSKDGSVRPLSVPWQCWFI